MAWVDSPEDIAVKTAAKRDLSFLKEVLRVTHAGTTVMSSPCQGCGGSHCLQVGQSKDSAGEWFWHCHKGCGNGDVLSALKVFENKSFKEIMTLLRQRYGRSIGPAERKEFDEQRQRDLKNKVFDVVQKQSETKPEPVLDAPRAEAFIQKHHEYLLKRMSIVSENERGLSEDVIRRYRIGYCEGERLVFKPWSPNGAMIQGAWVLPITNKENSLKSVRLHFEIKPEKCGKVISAPFGTCPAFDQEKDITPIHSYHGMFPDPETLRPDMGFEFDADRNWWIRQMPEKLRPSWEMKVSEERLAVAYAKKVDVEDLDMPGMDEAIDRAFQVMKKQIMTAVCKSANIGEDEARKRAEWDRYIFICPGELKALAMLSAGFMATAPTSGESWMPTPEWLNKFQGQKVCVFYDADAPKKNEKTGKVTNTGIDFAKKWTTLLLQHGASHVVAKCGGRKEK